jgi:hypothetical protein
MLAKFREDIIIEGGRNSSNFSSNKLFNNFFSFLLAHLSKAGSCFKLDIRNMFGRFPLLLA